MTDNELLNARFNEQLLPWVSWQRRSWQPGTILLLKELVEAAQWTARGVLSDEATQRLRGEAVAALKIDSGLNSGAVRAHLHDILRTPIKYHSQSRRELERLIAHLETSYIPAWKAQAAKSFNVERASRFLSAHLQDIGYSHSYLRKKESLGAARTAEELIEAVGYLADRPKRSYVGWVALKSAPNIVELKSSAAWVPARELTEVVHRAGSKVPREAIGGMRFAVSACDPISAVAEIRRDLRRFVGRTRLVRKSEKFEYYPIVYFEDQPPVSLKKPSIPVHVTSIARAGVVYSEPSDDPVPAAIDDALELASFLHGASVPAAVSNAWAAIESLLIDPEESAREAGGRVIAADRAAAVTAVAWLRAELTPLSHRLSKLEGLDPILANALRVSGDNNKLRCAALIDHWGRVECANIDHVDRAAINRMSSLIDDPKGVLSRVEKYMKNSFRRLYRQRNLVMHGGALRSVALDATARTTGPLVGALLDRLSVAAYVDGVDPLQSVANSQSLLKLAKTEGAPAYLLEA